MPKKLTISKARRDAFAIATGSPVHRLLSPREAAPLGVFFQPARSYLQHVVDNREWHPDDPVPELRDVFGKPSRIDIPNHGNKNRIVKRPLSKPNKKYQNAFDLPFVVAFKAPARTVVCIRRKVRKSVIHALGIAGRRVSKPKLRWTSAISCRRY